MTVSNAIVPGLYTLNVTNGGGAIVGTGPWTGDLEYTVTILDPKNTFGTVELDAQHVGASTKVTKDVDYAVHHLTLTSTNGSSAHGDISPWHTQTITVSDHFNVDAASALTSVQNSFSQVPEPSTFALLGFGGVGIAVAAYRRRRMAKVVA